MTEISTAYIIIWRLGSCNLDMLTAPLFRKGRKEKEGKKGNEKNVSTKGQTQKNGTWLQKKNEYKKR